MVPDADDQRLRRACREVGRIVRGLPPRSEDVELGEVLPLLRHRDDVSKRRKRRDDRDHKDDGERPVEPGVAGVEEFQTGRFKHLPRRNDEAVGGREEEAPVPGDPDHCEGEEGKRGKDRVEPDSPGSVVQGKPDEGGDGDREPEREGDPLDPVKVLFCREERGDQGVAGDEEDHRQAEEGLEKTLVQHRNINAEEGRRRRGGNRDEVAGNVSGGLQDQGLSVLWAHEAVCQVLLLHPRITVARARIGRRGVIGAAAGVVATGAVVAAVVVAAVTVVVGIVVVSAADAATRRV